MYSQLVCVSLAAGKLIYWREELDEGMKQNEGKNVLYVKYETISQRPIVKSEKWKQIANISLKKTLADLGN